MVRILQINASALLGMLAFGIVKIVTSEAVNVVTYQSKLMVSIAMT